MRSLAFVLSVLLFDAAQAQLIQVDPTFGDNGVSILPTPQGYGNISTADVVINSSDEVFVIGGTALVGSQRWLTCIAKMDPQGSLDQSYGNDGAVVFDIMNMSDNLRAGSLQPDGKVVAVGSRIDPNLGAAILVIRINTDGSLDTNFADHGFYTQYITTTGPGTNDVKVLSDGRIVVLGTMGGNVHLLCLNTDGSVDTSFGNNGEFQYYHSSGSCSGQRIDIDPQDRIVVGGGLGSILNPYALLVCRVLNDGTLDTSFGDNGATVLNYISDIDYSPSEHGESITDIVCDNASNIKFSGMYRIFAESHRTLGIWKLLESGMLDPDYGVGGTTAIVDQSNNPKSTRSMVNLPDGTSVVAGKFSGVGAPARMWSMEVTHTGSIVTDQIGNPFSNLSFTPHHSLGSIGASIAAQSNGRIVGNTSLSNGTSGIFAIRQDISTDVSNGDPMSDRSVYPNPASDVFQLSDLNNDISSLELYNILGQRQATYVSASQYHLPANLSSGKYFVRMVSSSGVDVLPLLIQR